MDSSAWPAPLAGQTILVAEEEASVSFNIEAQLIEAGANVVTVKDQRQGLLAAIGDRLTAAVLGDKLGDDPIDPICDCLASRSIPFLFLTGDSDKHAQKWAPAPIVSKPFDGRVLIDDLVRLLVTGGEMLDLDDTTRIDRIIFGAQTRLQRQEDIVGELTCAQHNLRNADGLLRIMRESLELLQRHRGRLMAGAEEIRH
jgi:DNA-binding response OmpR family regulator